MQEQAQAKQAQAQAEQAQAEQAQAQAEQAQAQAEQTQVKPTADDEMLLRIKAEYKRVCLYIVENIDVGSSVTAMYLDGTGARFEWITNLLRDHTYSLELLDMYKPIFKMDKACYKLAKLMTNTNHSQANKLYQLLSSISFDSEAIYSYDFVDDDYEENEEDEQRLFKEWHDDNVAKYKEIELICKNILEKLKK